MVFARLLAFGAYFGLFVCSAFFRVTLPLSNMRSCHGLGGLMTALGGPTAVFTARLLLPRGCERKTGSAGRLFQALPPGRN